MSGSRFDSTFLAYGWLVPCVLPWTQLGGRALFTIVGGLYLLWGLAVLARLRPRLPMPAWLPVLLMITAMAPSVFAAVDTGDAAKEWSKFALNCLTFVLTLAALHLRPDNGERLLRALGWSALGLLVLLYGMLPWQMSQAGFDPLQQLREDNLPWLTPFLLLLLAGGKPSRIRVGGAVVALLAVTLYIGLSHGRAALVGLMVALLVYAWRVLGWHWWRLLLAPACVLAIAVALNPERFFRAESPPLAVQQAAGPVSSDWAWLDQLSSYRTRLWRNAVAMPPDNPWTGVGMGQVGNYPEVVETHLTHAKHLHNFLFDAWYETGWLGAGALLAMLAVYLGRGFSAARRSQGADGIAAGALLAGVLALCAAACLSFSYTSRQFSVYLMLMLAGLQFLYTRADRRAGDDEPGA